MSLSIPTKHNGRAVLFAVADIEYAILNSVHSLNTLYENIYFV